MWFYTHNIFNIVKWCIVWMFPGPHCVGDWVGPIFCLDVMKKKKEHYPIRKSNSNRHPKCKNNSGHVHLWNFIFCNVRITAWVQWLFQQSFSEVVCPQAIVPVQAEGVEQDTMNHECDDWLCGRCSNGVLPIHFFQAEHRIQFRSRPVRFLGFNNHEKGSRRQEISKWSTVCSTFSRSGWRVVRSASLAKGGASKKRPSSHLHTVLTEVIRWVHERCKRSSYLFNLIV
jgi:hypothetical protein